MSISMTVLIIVATVGLSWYAFERPRLLDRLLLWPPAIRRDHQYDRFISHGFVHADWQHLAFNMITLYFFGRLVERWFTPYLGSFGFVLFYLSAILVAMLPSYLRHYNDPKYRSLGASGAVSAVLFIFVLVAPWSLIFVFFVPIPAILYAVLYVGYSLWAERRGGDNINHSAHLAGAAYGVLFTLVMEPRAAAGFLEALISPSFG